MRSLQPRDSAPAPPLACCNRSFPKNGRIRKKLFGRSADDHADAHSRGHGMAQVALSRAQPSSPYRPPSRSPRARPFTFTSAAGRELGDRAALASSLGILYCTCLMRLSYTRTHCMPLSALKASFMCKCLIENPQLLHKYRVLTGPSESPPKWSMYVTLSAALMAPTLVTASAMMAELGPVPLGPRHAVACARHAIIFVLS